MILRSVVKFLMLVNSSRREMNTTIACRTGAGGGYYTLFYTAWGRDGEEPGHKLFQLHP